MSQFHSAPFIAVHEMQRIAALEHNSEIFMTPSPTKNTARLIKLYGFPFSGHAHRISLFLSLLGLPSEYVKIDLPGKQHKTPEFLALNAFGQVPVIDDGGVILADSNAILVYLATKYGDAGWLPQDPLGAATVQRWLSVAAGPLAQGPALARVAQLFAKKADADAIARAHALLPIMDAELSKHAFLAGEKLTIADIANYTYVAHAPEGGVALDDYPHVRAWIARIEALPGFVPMARM
jgi:glutathione S-transferase